MKKKYRLALSIAIGGLVISGLSALFMRDILELWITPSHAFDAERAPKAPDYSLSRYWAASPGKQDFADILVSGEYDQQKSAAIDVFYIHPTAYYSNENWNSDMDSDKGSAQIVEYMLAAHASIFNACCKVYAPEYREAHIRSFAEDEGPLHAALDLAYSDVKRAFEYFLQYQNKGRPFVLVGHSQGTAHGMRLLEEFIEPNGLSDRMIAAYLIGYEMPIDKFTNGFKHTSLCEDADSIHCVITWGTYGENGDHEQEFDVPHWYPNGWQQSKGKTTACVYPLSWKSDNEFVTKDAHLGAVTSGDFSWFFKSILLNKHTGERPSKLNRIDRLTHARCQDGRLLIATQNDNAFSKGTTEEKQNYHGSDINLFYMNIRENVAHRIAQYLNN